MGGAALRPRLAPPAAVLGYGGLWGREPRGYGEAPGLTAAPEDGASAAAAAGPNRA